MFTPDLPIRIHVTRTESYELFIAEHDRGGRLEAMHCNANSDQLHLSEVRVHGQERSDIATELIRTTVRSVLEMPENRHIELVTANITNPMIPKLLDKVFGFNIAQYYEDKELRKQISPERTAQLVIEREAELLRMEREKIDQSEFNDGVDAVIPILDIDMSDWPLIILK